MFVCACAWRIGVFVQLKTPFAPGPSAQLSVDDRLHMKSAEPSAVGPGEIGGAMCVCVDVCGCSTDQIIEGCA